MVGRGFEETCFPALPYKPLATGLGALFRRRPFLVYYGPLPRDRETAE